MAIALLAIVLVPVTVSAQSTADTPALAQEIRTSVDKVFAVFDKTDSPGCAMAIVQNDRIVYARGYGMASLEHANPITPQTVFDIGSTSKQFSAMCIHLLAREGKLSLDDDIRKWLPEMRDYGKPITIRHLLHHTSGIRDYLGLMQLGGRSMSNDYTDAEVIGLIARQRELNFVPGDEHLYSNSGYFLLSAIVRRASGMTLRQYAAKNIFEPLGMKSTHFHDDPMEIVKNRALGYSPTGETTFAMDVSLFHVVGDGGVYTTVEDLAKWDRVFYDSPLAGGKAVVEGMLVPGKRNDGKALDYASGLNVAAYRGLRTIRHGGAWAGYRAEMLRFPDQRTTVIVLSNSGGTNPSGLANAVADVVLEKQLQPKPAPPVAAPSVASADRPKVTDVQARLFDGLYWEPKSDRIRRVTIKDGAGRYIRGLVDGPGASTALIVTGERSMRLDEPADAIDLVFTPGAPNAPRKFTVTINGADPVDFVALEYAPIPADRLGAFDGTFESDEVDSRVSVTVEGGRLMMLLPSQPAAVPLLHVTGDWFAGPVSVRFERKADGSVTGFRAGAGRMRNIEFRRVVLR